MDLTATPDLANVADFLEAGDLLELAPYRDAGYHDTGFGGAFKKLRRAVSRGARVATRGVPAVAQLMRAPDMLQKTTSAAGATALRTLRKADPAVYLSAVQAGARKLASRPEFNTAITGAKLLPGIGQGVSAGLAAAASLGAGQSLEDAALTAAREGFENPAARVAFDAAVGLARGGELADAEIEAARGQVPGGAAGKAAFDAGLALARRSAVSPDMVDAIRDGIEGETGAFDGAIRRASRAVAVERMPEFPTLPRDAQQAATALLTIPRLRKMRLRDAADELGVSPMTMQRALAAICNHRGNTGAFDSFDIGDLDTAEETAVRLRVVKPGQSWDKPKIRPVARTLPETAVRIRVVKPGQSWDKPKIRPVARTLPKIRLSRAFALKIGKAGGPVVMNALVRHGVLARIAGNTGELTGPTAWTIRSGDFPSGIAAKLTGNGGRWRELLAANPGMTTYTDAKGQTQVKPWAVGQVVNVPASWVGAPSSSGGTPSPGTPTLPAAPPVQPTSSSSAGGPPFPAPSRYPGGYPGSTYTVQAGDFGTKIAETITGNGARWRELLVTNPGKADPQFGIKVFSGDVLKLPAEWQAPAAKAPSPPSGGGLPTPPTLPTIPATTTQPTLPGVPTTTQVMATAQQIAIVQAMLVTFHGKHPEAGFLAPYGSARFGGQADDLAGQWSSRCQAALASFQRWWNTKGKQPPLPQDGFPDESTVSALYRQTSDDLAVPLPPGGGPPTLPGGTTATSSGSSATTAPAPSSGSGAGPLAALLLGAYALFG